MIIEGIAVEKISRLSAGDPETKSLQCRAATVGENFSYDDEVAEL